jgi:single-strand DNA-binding protein
MSKLKAQAIGYLGHSCKIKEVNGYNAISFSVACSEKFKDKSGMQVERTIWIDCTLWRKPEHSGVSAYLKKGTQVWVEGRPDVRAYSSRQDGSPVGVLILRVDDIELLSGAKTIAASDATVSENTPATNNDNNNFTAGSQEDDLPF